MMRHTEGAVGEISTRCQILFAGFLDCFVRRHDAQLLPFIVNHAYFARRIRWFGVRMEKTLSIQSSVGLSD